MDDKTNAGTSKRNIVIGGAIVLVIALLVAGVLFATNDSPNSTTSQTNQQGASNTTDQDQNGSNTTGNSDASNASYKNGTYEADGTYRSPGGPTTIGVSLTLENGIIKDATVTSKADNRTSKQYQSKFISGYKSEVVGKNINDIELSEVSGSSLTPNGFNDAVEKIKEEAKA